MSTTLVDDALLPAAVHLTDDRARDVVAAAVQAGGGEVRSLDVTQVLYRPGRELVVQYRAMVSWQDTPAIPETLLAGTTVTGPPPGTLVVQAEGDSEVDPPLEVGVWRYPFDPALGGLGLGVMAPSVADLLLLDRSPDLTVVSFRPCRRAVVRATWCGGEAFVKIVPPSETAALVARHERLIASGLPVPDVLAVDRAHGLIALRALPGTDLRTQLLIGDGPLPAPASWADLVARIATVDLVGIPTSTRPSLTSAAPRHAAMLARVMPDTSRTLEELVAAVGADRPGPVGTVHGDLHEAQVRVDDNGNIVGLLDVDDVGPGDPLDDLARSIGHLLALSFVAGPAARRVRAHADHLHQLLIEQFDPIELDRRIGAALIGLATGPFRSQMASWQREAWRLLDEAADLLGLERGCR